MRSHRELIAWQRAHELAIDSHKYCAQTWSPVHAAAIDQLRRASLSIQLNIAEGFAFGRSARCRHHLRIAYGSAVETTEILEFLDELKAPDAHHIGMLVDLSHRVQALTLRLWQRSKV
jgi:four helix bundle protein